MANNYLYPSSMPYDEINIYDNSRYSDESQSVDVSTIPEGPIAFIPFVSPKGYKNDNELVYLSKSALRKYGDPNLSKYGLSLYLANQFIDGNGSLLGMRVTADNATHSHAFVNAKIVLRKVAQVDTVVNPTTSAVTYVPYFKEHGDTSAEPATIDGITYTYQTSDQGVVTGTIVIDPKAKVPGTDTALTSVYRVNGDTLVDADNPSTVLFDLVKYDKIVTKFETQYYEPSTGYCRTADSIRNRISVIGNPMTPVVEPVDGRIPLVENTEYTIPLFALYARPTGENNYNFSITSDDTMENYANDTGVADRFYNISLLDGSSKLEPKMAFSLSDYVYSSDSMYVEDVFDEHASNVGFIPGEIEFFRNLIKQYAPDDVDANSIDILFGSDRDSKAYSFYEIDPSGVNLSGVISFQGGSMGDFDSEDETTRTNAINEALANAYEGRITDLIFDEVRYPFEFVFQPCSASTVSGTHVCDAIHSLVDIRESTTACMYIPETTTYASARTEKDRVYADYTSAKEYFYCESAMIRDPYTHKRVRMPSVYFNAKAIPRAIKSLGYGTPFAGRSFYWDGFITNTLMPRSYNEQEYINNHKAGLNTLIEDGNGIANPHEQITAQPYTSALSEINNSITLRKMCNIALSIAREKRWTDISDPTEISEYGNTVSNAIQTQLSNAYQTFNLVAERETVNGAGKSRIHCRIEVTFRTLFKGVTYSFYIL